MNVAILGGGNGSYTTAADLALAGHRVRLWRRVGGATWPRCRPAAPSRWLAEGRRGRRPPGSRDRGSRRGARRRRGRDRAAAGHVARGPGPAPGRAAHRQGDRAAHAGDVRLATRSRAIWRAPAGRCRSPSPRAARCRISRARPGRRRCRRRCARPTCRWACSRPRARRWRWSGISRAVPGHPAVRGRARRRADQRGPGHPSAAGAGERGRDRRRDASTSTPPAPRPARGGSSTRSTPSGSPPARASATRRPTTSWPPTTTRRARRKGSTAPAPSRSWWPAASGARSLTLRAPLRERGRRARPDALRIRGAYGRLRPRRPSRACSACSARCSAAISPAAARSITWGSATSRGARCVCCCTRAGSRTRGRERSGERAPRAAGRRRGRRARDRRCALSADPARDARRAPEGGRDGARPARGRVLRGRRPGGRRAGERVAVRLAGRTRSGRLMETGGAIGWGAFALERLTAETMVVVVRRSPVRRGVRAVSRRRCAI